ncbi:hypothetical protein BZG82_15780 [Salinivibrio sp. PR5]|nr:hypothetical protein BZG82_15780 [Salinivibrio sp. PR5]OOF10316.1 hypothetical protein BZG83_14005 [Salinivibrio sp. PR919]OOF13232.1 hypothetical protein BZG84_15980 [Salinivibrio sp. PR932]
MLFYKMEKIMKGVLVPLLALFLTGCAGFGQVERVDDLSLTQIKAMNEIEIIQNPSSLKYVSKGKIKGISCKGSAFSGDTSEQAAMTQLKIKAVQLGANAVLYPTCSQDASVDWGNNCWESWVCIGEAAFLE